MLKVLRFRTRKFLFKGVVATSLVVRHWLNFSRNQELKNIPLERQRRALATTVDFVEKHLRVLPTCGTKKELLDKAFERADVSGDRLICEFGVFMGVSINHIAKKTTQRVYGFDAFQGLPEAWLDVWKKGDFNVPKPPRVRKNVELVIGWFNETIPGFLKKHPGTVGFLHVDSDIYSSAKTIFETFETRLKPGTVIVFDEYFNYPEWEQGEHKAFEDFLQRTGYGVEYIGYLRNEEPLAVILREK